MSISEKMPPLQPSFINILFMSIKEKDDFRALLQLLTLLTVLIPALALGVGSIAVWIYNLFFDKFPDFVNSHPELATYAGLFGLFIIVLLLAATQSKRALNKLLSKADLQGDFRFLQHVSLCLVYSKSKIVYRFRYYVKCRTDGIRTFPIRFQWSGSGTLSITPNDPNHSIIERSDKSSSSWKIYDINLSRTLNKGDTEIIQYDINTESDIGREAMPYFGFTVSSPKYSLLNNFLIIAFSDEVKIASAYRERYFSPLADRSYASTPVELDSDRCLTWPVLARLGIKYCQSWVYKE